MIRRAGTAKRLFERDAAFPQGLADDRAGCRQALEVGHHGDAAGRLDRCFGQPPGDLLVKLHVRPEQHAVAADVGDEEVARLRVKLGDIPQATAAVLGPAGDSNHWSPLAEPHIERQSDALRPEFLDPFPYNVGPLHREAADRHPCDAGLEHARETLALAHAAGDLQAERRCAGEIGNQLMLDR